MKKFIPILLSALLFGTQATARAPLTAEEADIAALLDKQLQKQATMVAFRDNEPDAYADMVDKAARYIVRNPDAPPQEVMGILDTTFSPILDNRIMKVSDAVFHQKAAVLIDHMAWVTEQAPTQCYKAIFARGMANLDMELMRQMLASNQEAAQKADIALLQDKGRASMVAEADIKAAKEAVEKEIAAQFGERYRHLVQHYQEAASDEQQTLCQATTTYYRLLNDPEDPAKLAVLRRLLVYTR